MSVVYFYSPFYPQHQCLSHSKYSTTFSELIADPKLGSICLLSFTCISSLCSVSTSSVYLQPLPMASSYSLTWLLCLFSFSYHQLVCRLFISHSKAQREMFWLDRQVQCPVWSTLAEHDSQALWAPFRVQLPVITSKVTKYKVYFGIKYTRSCSEEVCGYGRHLACHSRNSKWESDWYAVTFQVRF